MSRTRKRNRPASEKRSNQGNHFLPFLAAFLGFSSLWVSKKAVKKLIDKHVAPSSTMVTDGYAMYAYLGRGTQFTHVVVDHKNGQYVNGGFHTNGIEGFWSLLKRGIIGIFHQVSPQHLQRYCDEFAARYNTRGIKDAERFVLSVQNSEGRLKYNQLIGKE